MREEGWKHSLARDKNTACMSSHAMSSDDWMDFLADDSDVGLDLSDSLIGQGAFSVAPSDIRPYPRDALVYAKHHQPPAFSPEERVEMAYGTFEFGVLYERDGDRAMVVEADCKTMIMEAFSSCFIGSKETTYDKEDVTFSSVLQSIKQKSNHDIIKIERVRNDQQSGMHSSFKTLYGIVNCRTVYHGTSRKSSENIARKGFRGAASYRAKFGKGIYTSSNVWEAIAYAEPCSEFMYQTFMVVSLLQGPTCIGSANMVDFGYDQLDRPILTTTNPENTIFCASHGSQLLSMYRVTVRHDAVIVPSVAQKNMVQIYNPVVWSHMSPPVVVVVPATQTKGVDTVCVVKKLLHRSIAVGDKVEIVKNDAILDFSKGHAGYVRHILKYNFYKYYVEVDDPDVQARMKLHNVMLHATDRYRDVNTAFKIEDTMVPCDFLHIVKK